jgi:beta-N-acetylhexosaminidase
MQTLNSIFMDIAFSYLTAEDKALLAHPLVGGLTLFTRNFKSYAQLQDLIKEIISTKIFRYSVIPGSQE